MKTKSKNDENNWENPPKKAALKIPEAADHLGVSTSSIRRLIDRGALKP